MRHCWTPVVMLVVLGCVATAPGAAEREPAPKAGVNSADEADSVALVRWSRDVSMCPVAAWSALIAGGSSACVKADRDMSNTSACDWRTTSRSSLWSSAPPD